MKFDTIEELINYYHYKKETVFIVDGTGIKEVSINSLESNKVFSHSFENLCLVINQG